MFLVSFKYLVGLCIIASGTNGQQHNLTGIQIKNTDIDDSDVPRNIIGGARSESSYQVSIDVRDMHVCAGSIINPNWILTAAHCCTSLRPSQVKLRVGSTNHDTGGDIYFVQKIMFHNDYDKDTNNNDVCVMKTTQPISFGRSVRSITMVNTEYSYTVGAQATVSGWGQTDENSPLLSKYLQMVEVPVISEKQCREAYQKSGLHHRITDQQICAGFPQGGKDSCQGDSGGALVINGKLAGIVSWGLGCGNGQYPGVYANVAALRNWIRTQTSV